MDFDGLEEATLLRLGLLRDLLRDLHTEKSRVLAGGKSQAAMLESYRTTEQAIERLRSVSPLAGPIEPLLNEPREVRKRTRLLPEALFHSIPKQKFERFDRIWETAIAAEGVQLGWSFWELDAWIEVSAIQHWVERLSDAVSPHGILLFSEGAPPRPGEPAPPPEGLWHGLFVLLLKPHFRTPDFGVAKIPGTASTPKSPTWRVLFTPKRR